MKNKFIPFTLLLFTLLFSLNARAELVIRITDGVKDGIPIMVLPFPGNRMARIIEDDLQRSGRFTLIDPRRAAQPLTFGQPAQQPQLLKNSGAQYIIVGRPGNGVEFEIITAATGQRLEAYNVVLQPNQRRMGHQAADIIFERLTGTRGAFDTRIAYVSAIGPAGNQTYRLIVAEADGHNPRTILTSDKPVMSPTWSPDARKLAYVSFESGRSAIYVQDLSSGSAIPVSTGGGMNGAPAWSPDGTKIAMSLSQDGNADIYVVSAFGGAPRRITSSRAIDTEPSWANVNTIVYTSDQGGRPQLYRTSVGGGDGSRFTFNGSENSAASVVGNTVAMVRINGNVSRIAVMNAANKNTVMVSRGGRFDESPSLAPNGSMVIYSTEANRRGVLAVASSNGKARQILSAQEGHVRDAAWSPYLN